MQLTVGVAASTVTPFLPASATLGLAGSSPIVPHRRQRFSSADDVRRPRCCRSCVPGIHARQPPSVRPAVKVAVMPVASATSCRFDRCHSASMPQQLHNVCIIDTVRHGRRRGGVGASSGIQCVLRSTRLGSRPACPASAIHGDGQPAAPASMAPPPNDGGGICLGRRHRPATPCPVIECCRGPNFPGQLQQRSSAAEVAAMFARGVAQRPTGPTPTIGSRDPGFVAPCRGE